jgi:hypothetical protein
MQSLDDGHGREIGCGIACAMQYINVFTAGSDGKKKLLKISKKKPVYVLYL